MRMLQLAGPRIEDAVYVVFLYALQGSRIDIVFIALQELAHLIGNEMTSTELQLRL